VGKVQEYRKDNERVLVTTRIENPEPFFKFYLKDNNLENYEFRTFDIWKEQTKDGLFVDVLPNDPSPAEPLYSEGGYPEEIEVLGEIQDKYNDQMILVYRYK
jgi:hypothetical protein